MAATVTKKNDIKLSWTKPSPLPAQFRAHEIRSGASWTAGTFIDHTEEQKFIIHDPSPGTTTYWVGVLLHNGIYDATPPSIAATVSTPGDVTSLAATVSNKGDVRLSWVKPGSLPAVPATLFNSQV